ncbi:MAG: hypothetical protein FJY67_05455 [Calditrichaeota bacterium]|nr:hypothetical protein [Calditrichota bacterium]
MSHNKVVIRQEVKRDSYVRHPTGTLRRRNRTAGVDRARIVESVAASTGGTITATHHSTLLRR